MIRAHDFFAVLEAYADRARTTPDAVGPRLMRTVLKWHQNATTRRQLACLDDDQLRDIGVARGDAANEASRPFWR